MGPLLCSLELLKAVTEVSVTMGGAAGAWVAWFLDDGTLFGPLRLLNPSVRLGC